METDGGIPSKGHNSNKTVPTDMGASAETLTCSSKEKKSSSLGVTAAGRLRGIRAAGSSVGREQHSVVRRKVMWSLLVYSFTQRSLNLGSETEASSAALESIVAANSSFDCSHNNLRQPSGHWQ